MEIKCKDRENYRENIIFDLSFNSYVENFKVEKRRKILVLENNESKCSI